MDYFKACGEWGHVLATRASPVLVPTTYTRHNCFHGGQYYTEYATFE